MRKCLDTFFNEIVKALSIIICSVFVTMGIVSHIRIDIYENAYVIRNNPIISILIWSAVLLLLFIVFKGSKFIELSKGRVFWVTLVIGIIWVLISQNKPTDDADHCMRVAEELLDGILNSFKPGEYLDVWRQQYFLVLFMCVLTILGGVYNYILFQVLNALIFAWMCSELYAVISEKNIHFANFQFIVLLLCFPIWMSVTYVYGNLIGMSLGVIALIYQYRFLKTAKKSYAVASSVLICIAILFKMFALIYFIAMIVVYIWSFIVDRKKSRLLWGLLCILMLFSFNKMVDVVMSEASDHTISDKGGTSLFASIVMGMDIHEEDTNPGWYNGYNVYTYFDSEYDSGKTYERNKDDFQWVIYRLIHTPDDYVAAHFKKSMTVWNEPTFDVLYRMRIDNSSGVERYSRGYADLIADSGKLHRVLILFLGCFQTLIYLSALLFVVMFFKESEHLELGGLITFIGGVLFLIFWEGKSEYALFFFTPLIVYSAYGLFRIIELIFNKELFKKCLQIKSKILEKNSIIYIIDAIIIVVCLGVTLIFVPSTSDEDSWDEYIMQHTYIQPGKYDLINVGYDSPNAIVSNVFVNFNRMYGTEWAYVIMDNSDRHYLKFQDWKTIDRNGVGKYCGILNSDYYDLLKYDNDNPYYLIEEDSDCHWIIYKENSGYLIKLYSNQNMVWTYDNDSNIVVLKPYEEGNMNQIWKLK